MSHYKPYPAYKDSGVEWLGRVPEHWQLMPLKRLVRSIEQGWSPECEARPAESGEWGVVKVGCVNGGRFRPEENKALPVSLEPRPELGLCKGDVLVSRANTRELVGSCAVVPQDYPNLLLCDKIYRIRAGERVTPEFLAALITVHGRRAVEIEATGASSSMLNISQSVILDLPVALPEPAEQDQIMAAASHETARIDALVAKKTRFIELLREKRQALITHAVTRGLDPNVKMKDSGVEWLGEVPEHWRVMAIKHIVVTPITDGPHETPEFLDEGVPFVSAEAVSSGRVDFAKIRGFISRDDHERYSQKYCPQRGDIFMIKSGATTGVTAIVETDDEFNIWSPLAVIRCGEISDSYFVLHFMRSRSFQEAVALSWSYGTQQNIGMGVIGNLAVTVPPLEEQQRIAQLVQAKCGRLDALVKKTECSIDLLKERRSALITAAVTGQIDLREAS